MDVHVGRFEELLEQLVEGAFARVFAGQLRPQEIATKMARAMEDRALSEVAPDSYFIHLNPADHEKLLAAEPGLAQILADQVVALARQATLDLAVSPTVELRPDPAVPSRAVWVTASVTSQPEEPTQVMDLAQLQSTLSRPPDGSTYLIIDGQHLVPLTRPVYTLGRRLDCDLVLSDPRVSRQHAQLRWRFGRYMLFDLGSRAGTTVNGHPVSEAVLEPGDVISVGGVDIIYGRDAGEDKLPAEGDATGSWSRRRPDSALPAG